MKLAVGSLNSSKVSAMRRVAALLLAGAEVESCHVGTGVPAQPVGEAETFEGARWRAAHALQQVEADVGVGLETGVLRWGAHYVLVNWVVARGRDGTTGWGRGVSLPLPRVFDAVLDAGGELAEAVDALGGQGMARREGALGFLTRGTLTREAMWSQAAVAALLPWARPDLYPGGVALPVFIR